MGNAVAANKVIEEMQNDQSSFPIIPKAQLEKSWLRVETPALDLDLAIKILSQIENPGDIESGIAQLKTLMLNPMTETGKPLSTLGSVLSKLEGLSSGYSALNEGNIDVAVEIYKSLKGTSLQYHFRLHLDGLENKFEAAAIVAKVERITGKAYRDVLPEALMQVAVDRCLNSEDYSTAIELIRFEIDLKRKYEAGIIVGALSNFLAAQRYERANDHLAAYVFYKKVLSVELDNPHVHERAIASIKRIRETHPEMVKAFNDSAITGELNEIKEQLKLIRSRRR